MTDYYIDPANGDNSNAGTSLDAAFADFGPVNSGGGSALTAGDRCFVRDTAQIPSSGFCYLSGQGSTSGDEILITGWQDERPVLDGSDGTNAHAFNVDGSANVENVTIRQFEVQNFDQNAVRMWGATKQCEVVDLIGHDNGQGGSTGVTVIINGGGTAGDSNGNVVRGCVSYNNQAGGNSDGFVVNNNASNALFEDCISVHDPDDGFDAFDSDDASPSTFRRCVAINSGSTYDGSSTGNGNGFKMGGGAGTGGHTIERCVAIGVDGTGFYDNGADVSLTFRNNTAVRAGADGFHTWGSNHVLRNNIAVESASDNYEDAGSSNDDAFNTWNLGITPTFRSESLTDDDKFPADRHFLRLVEGDAAINAGDPGTADSVSSRGIPDLGAYEYLPPEQRLPVGTKLVYDGTSYAPTGGNTPAQPTDVRLYHNHQPGTRAYHNGDGGNVEGPAFVNDRWAWVSAVDGSTIS